MQESGELAEEGPVEPEAVDDGAESSGHAEQRHQQVGQRQVEQVQVLGLAQRLPLPHQRHQHQQVAQHRHQEDGSVEREENDSAEGEVPEDVVLELGEDVGGAREVEPGQEDGEVVFFQEGLVGHELQDLVHDSAPFFPPVFGTFLLLFVVLVLLLSLLWLLLFSR